MLNFFRINDPYRLIGVFIILIIFRLPFWLSDAAMTIPQLDWLLVASRLSEGATMYKEVWDTLSPLSAGFYWITSIIFGNSFLASQILSVLLIFVQGAIFNTILINQGALSENTYIPAAVYVTLASLFFDFFLVSPVVLANTFILLAINNVFGQIEIRAKRDEKLLMTGVYLGVATLFYFPYFIFGPVIVIVFILFTATVRRRYFLYLFGWTLPIVLVMLYYYFNDSLGLFWRNYVYSWFHIEAKSYLSFKQVIILVGYITIFLIFSILRIFSRARLTNYQSRLIQAVFIIMLFSFTILIIEVDRYPFDFLVFIVPVAFLISHFFSLARKSLLGELVFVIFLAGVGFINYKSIVDTRKGGIFKIDSYFVDNINNGEEVENKKIFYAGDNLSIYHNAFPATPFINWRLASEILEDPGKLRNLTILGRSIEEDRPEIIFDPSGLVSGFFLHSPAIAREYRKEGDRFYLNTKN